MRPADDSHRTPPARAQIMLQVTLAVAACHEQRIVHRDIKPENVFMDAEGVCMLADFGLATQTGGLKRVVSHVGRAALAAPPPHRAAGRRCRCRAT